MAYEFERDEWRSAVRSLSDTQLAANRDAHRAALGITGDAADNLPDPDLADLEAEQ